MQENAFEPKKEKPGLSANRPSNNLAPSLFFLSEKHKNYGS